jgi:putative ABC transport system permease protein
MNPLRTSGQLRSAMYTIRRSKMHSFWTMLGIIIGVTSVITIVAIGEGIKDQVSSQIHQFGPNIITVRTGQLNTESGLSDSRISDLSGFSVSTPLTQKDIDTVSKVKGVDASAPLTLTSGKVQDNNGVYNQGVVIGTGPDLPSLLNQSLAYGSFISSEDDQSNNQIAILGQNAADVMFDEDVPLGRSFEFHGQTFIVKGIFNQFNGVPLSQQANFNNAIFIPNDVAQSLSNNTSPTYEILARSAKDNQVNQTAKRITNALNYSHGGSSGFNVLTGNQNLTSNNDILSLLTSLIAGVAAISLLVAGIGIMNVMLVSVTERVREIGIKKAVGATNRQILNQFVFESGLISLIGGLIGIALSYLIELALILLTDLKPVIEWQIVVIATGVSLLVGVVFGSIPALKAARKDPIDALRAE